MSGARRSQRSSRISSRSKWSTSRCTIRRAVPTNGNYIEALGGNGVTGWDWIINAFTLARQYFPNAKLMLNDYSITNDGNATTTYLQSSTCSRSAASSTPSASRVMRSFNHTNLPRRRPRTATTLLASRPPGCRSTSPSSTSTASMRCGDFRTIRRSCSGTSAVPGVLGEPGGQGHHIWGYVQDSTGAAVQGAWLMYTNGAERPALQWLVRYVENNPRWSRRARRSASNELPSARRWSNRWPGDRRRIRMPERCRSGS